MRAEKDCKNSCGKRIVFYTVTVIIFTNNSC